MALGAADTARAANARYGYNQTRCTAVVETTETIYQGGIYVTNASGTALVPTGTSTTTVFLGVAVANTAATETGTFIRGVAINIDVKTGTSAGCIGHKAYAFDDDTVTALATVGPPIGVFQEIDTTALTAWVYLPTEPLGTAS